MTIDRTQPLVQSQPPPASIEAAMERFLSDVPDDVLAEFRALPRADAITGFGPGSGMSLRNAWGLWRDDHPLARELTAAGVSHGDDRSAVLLTALWCRLNDNAPFDIAAEAAVYHAHWAAAGLGPDGRPLS